MAGIININTDITWTASNWVYWNLMDAVLDLMPRRDHLLVFVEECKWMQCLQISQGDEDVSNVSSQIIPYLVDAARMCSDGKVTAVVNNTPLDKESQAQFKESIGELVKLLGTHLAP